MSAWPTRPLAELCEVAGGGTPPRNNPEMFGGGVPWVKIGDMLQGTILSTEETISPRALSSTSAKLLPKGSILLSIFATIGRTATLGVNAATNQAIAGIQIREPRLICAKFLRRFLDVSASELESRSRGVAQANINLSILRAHLVPLPCLSEQRRIAAILDQADALRAKRRVALAQLDEMVQSIFVDMFGDPATNSKGWPITQIGHLLLSATYGSSEKAGNAGAFPMLRMNNITYSGKLNLHDLKHIDLHNKDVPRYTVQSGDILFNRTNSADLVGKTAVFDKAEPYAFAGYLVRLRVNETAAPEYIAGFLNSGYGKSVLKSMCKSIIGMADINAKEVQSIRIPLPPRHLQAKYVEMLQAVAALREMQERSHARLNTLFASLQHRAFRGEL